MSRCRYWVFTINNPEDTPLLFADKAQQATDFRYLVFQQEQGLENGVNHYQGYLEFNKTKRLQWLKNHIDDRAHWEPRRGTAEQAKDYATKAATRTDGPWEYGTWDPKVMGQRTDLQTGCTLVADGGIDSLVDEAPELFVKYNRGFTALATHFSSKRKRDFDGVKVCLSYGIPGCGKTRSVREEYNEADLYVHEPGSPWFDGYTGQSCLLLDDFAGSATGFRLDQTLILLDKYKARLPIKGGHTYLTADTVWVTTNIHPIYWFKWTGREVQYKALARRFDEVYIWEGHDRILLADHAVEQFWDTNEMEPYGTEWGDIKVPMPRVQDHHQ